MLVTFTKHARERMEERGVSRAEVLQVLAFGQPRESCGNPVWSVNMSRPAEGYWRSALAHLRVVCTADWTVVTVYRAGCH